MSQTTIPASLRLAFILSQTPSPHTQRCEYASKRCENVRALKPNGDHHRLCYYHRRLANNNQRRWHNRKKMLQRCAQQSTALSVLDVMGDTSQQFLVAREQVGLNYHHHAKPPRSSRTSFAAARPVLPLPMKDEPCVLPRLRQHEVLSHALFLPVSQAHDQAADGLEFGGLPRGPTIRFPSPADRLIADEQSVIEAAYFDSACGSPLGETPRYP